MVVVEIKKKFVVIPNLSSSIIKYLPLLPTENFAKLADKLKIPKNEIKYVLKIKRKDIEYLSNPTYFLLTEKGYREYLKDPQNLFKYGQPCDNIDKYKEIFCIVDNEVMSSFIADNEEKSKYGSKNKMYATIVEYRDDINIKAKEILDHLKKYFPEEFKAFEVLYIIETEGGI